MTTSIIAGSIFVFFGIIAFATGLLNWQVLLEPARNYTIINAMGPTGKRVFYCILGIFLWAVGMAFILGWIRFGASQ